MTASTAICIGVSWWNQPTLRALLAAEVLAAEFHEAFAAGLEAAVRSGAPVFAWASKVAPDQEARARSDGIALTLIEDGFLRSVGLGAGLARGGAYIFDRQGIYYDATRPSDIETLLETAEITPEQEQRAERLVADIRAARISKYNVGRRAPMLDLPRGRERILVVGQVASDAGVRRTLSATLDCVGSPNINRDLLEAARSANPNSFIIYKPHPDVAGGLRAGRIETADQSKLADAVIADLDIIDLIEACDRLVTLSSLSGFEAILRGKPVTIHGLPFYAGWGLTDDLTPSPRRTRRRRVAELAAIALVLASRYIDPVTLVPCTPEAMVARLGAQRASPLHRIGSRLKQQASWAGRKLGL